MSRLARRFIRYVVCSLCIIFSGSMVCNTYLVKRMLLYEEREQLSKFCDTFFKTIHSDTDIDFAGIERTESVFIVSVEYISDNDILNERLMQAIWDKRAGIKPFWLWEEDQKDIFRDGKKMKLYPQKNLKYSVLVEYLLVDTMLYAIIKPIPFIHSAVVLINKINWVVFIVALFISIGAICLLVKRITEPLIMLKETAAAIAAQDFREAQIFTHDELEDLAECINTMSHSLYIQQHALEEKNQQMRDLLDNVSHDLKTPVALIKAYATGIRDNLDDGTFLDTILTQADRIDTLLVSLLSLSRLRLRDHRPVVKINVSVLLESMIKQFSLYAKQSNQYFQTEVTPSCEVLCDRADAEMIISNLLSNAIRYNCGEKIIVRLTEENTGTVLMVRNKVSGITEADTARFWEPFYRFDTSRTSEHHASGLGLASVKAAAERNDCTCSCELAESDIIFSIYFVT